MSGLSAVVVAPRPLHGEADLAALSDGDLLARFFRLKEESAFAEVLRRYGGLVYGVCRRVLRDANDAEDAFQATFLVFVRKGASLRRPERVASWLYGVAHRVARKAKSRAAQRPAERPPPMPLTYPPVDLTYQELCEILDEEISHLPQKYALPLVLCYLEGKTNAQAAAQLGWPEGSMSRRLARARELLQSRLSRRGLALTAALVASVFASRARAELPPLLVETTSRAASLVARGVDVGEVVSPATAGLVREMLSGLSLLQAGLSAALALVLVIAAAVGLRHAGKSAYGAGGIGGAGTNVMGSHTACSTQAAIPLEPPAAGGSCAAPR